SARNARATKLNQATADLTDAIFARIPGPVQPRQIELNEAGGREFEQGLRDTDKHRPAANTRARATLVMTQAEFLGFVEVDFDLRSPGISRDGRDGLQLEIGRQQIPGLELRQLRDDDDQDADWADAPGLDPAEQDLRVIDLDDPLFALHPELDALHPKAFGKLPEQLINAAFLAIDLLAPFPPLAAR